MNQNNPFAKLGALDQKLYQETTSTQHSEVVENGTKKDQNTKSQHAGMPASQKTSKPESQDASNMASQKAGNTAIQQTGNIHVPEHITATEKVTYRFHAEGKYAVEDMK